MSTTDLVTCPHCNTVQLRKLPDCLFCGQSLPVKPLHDEGIWRAAPLAEVYQQAARKGHTFGAAAAPAAIRAAQAVGKLTSAAAPVVRTSLASFRDTLAVAFARGAIPGTPIEQEIKKLQARHTGCWVCLLAGVPLCAVGVGLIFLAMATICLCLMLHQLWSLIPSNLAKTTPNRAVACLFIPFFNLYWAFVALWGLAKDLNRILRQRGIGMAKVNEHLVLLICVLHASWPLALLSGPFRPMGIGLCLVNVVLVCAAMRGLKDAGTEILRQIGAREADVLAVTQLA